MNELIFSSATELARAIRDREVSSAQVVKAFLERIDEVNPPLNALVQLRGKAALAEAELADAALACEEIKGPLHGVPVTVKEAIATVGMFWSGGTLGRTRLLAREDATAVARLRKAGAIVLGVTNLPDLSFGYESDNLVYGRTNNPYDASRTPGGSSGGEAAIIAAAGSPLGLGGDYLGNIRVPAHFCGIAGLRPNPGRVPGTGYFPPTGGLVGLLAQIGPMARRVEDLELALSIIAGPDGRDPYAAPAPLRSSDEVSMNGLRVAFYTNNGIVPPSAETAETVEAAVEALAEAGAIVTEDCPREIEQSFDLFLELIGADGGESLRAVLRMAGSERAHPLLEAALERLSGEEKSAARFMGLWHHWDHWRRDMLSFINKYDVIVSPVCATPAMPHETTLKQLAAFSYVHTYSLSASPAVVVRAGTSSEGLPIGVQLVPQHWREDVALAAARQIELALGGWQPAKEAGVAEPMMQ